jgi:glycosyltransferase involved in cell wall biosynthesis
VRAGHEVEVISSRHPEGACDEVVGGVRYVFVDAPTHQNHPAWLRESYAGYARRHTTRPFDVVHSESTSATELVRRGVQTRVPLVVAFHGNFLGHAKARLRGGVRTRRPLGTVRAIRSVQWLATHEHFRHGAWYRYRSCEAIVPSSQQLIDTCRSHLLKRSRVHVVPNGIDVTVFRPRPRLATRMQLGFDEGRALPLFVTAGRLERGKGIHHAIRALALLAHRGRPARLAVVGSGPDRERLERVAHEFGLESRVDFLGAQPHEVLAGYLAAADAFLFPTELNEAAPLAPLQALACGTPLIASDIGSIPGLIGSAEENGLLVPAGEPEPLAEAMQRILEDADFQQRLSVAGVALVRHEYTLEKMVERTLAVYEIARQRQRSSAARP